jgi:hypothetical protein
VFWQSATQRAAKPEQVAQFLPDVSVCDENEIVQYITPLTTEFVIFTGSFYFYNEVRRWIRSIAASDS